MIGRRATAALAVLAAAVAGLTLPTTVDASAAACSTPSKVTLAKKSVVATAPLAGRVYLKCKVSRAVRVTLTGTGLKVPASVVVKARKPSAAFTAIVLPSTVHKKAAVAAKAGGVARKSVVAVVPSCASNISSLTMPASVYALEPLVGTVRLACAPKSAVTVALSSSDPSSKVPASVTIPAGRTTASVPVTTASYGDQRTAIFAAKYAGATRYGSTFITPTLTLVEISPTQDSLNVPLAGCLHGDNEVTVSIKTSNPAITFPATAILGGCGGGISGGHVHPVSVDTPVTVSVQLGKRTLSASTVVLAPFAPGDGVTIGTDEFAPYLGLVQDDLDVRVVLDHPAPAGGTLVTWKVRDNNPAVVRVGAPEEDRILEGDTSSDATFALGDVTHTVTAYIDATIGSTTVSLPITVEPRIVSITMPDHVDASTPFMATLTMAGTSTTDQKIYFDSYTDIVAPQVVTVPANQTQVQFPVTVENADPGNPDGNPYRQLTGRRIAYDGSQTVEEVESNVTMINP